MGASKCVSTGIADYSLSALLSIKLTPATEQAVAFACGLLVAGIALWKMNGFVLLASRQKFSTVRNKSLLSLLAVLLFSSILSALFLLSWTKLFQPAYNSNTILDCFILLASFPAAISVLDQKRLGNGPIVDSPVRRSRWQQQSELKLLKEAIDPHFFFNSLNIMSYLIDSDPSKAKLFNDRLAEVYRYIVVNKPKKLVSLQAELQFIQNYFSLLTIRYPEGLELSISASNAEEWMLPPVSLQLLVENAIKHNQFSKENPLRICISATSKEVVVSNQLRRKKKAEDGCRSGLQNLAARYELTTGKRISVLHRQHQFLVKLPLVKGEPDV